MSGDLFYKRLNKLMFSIISFADCLIELFIFIRPWALVRSLHRCRSGRTCHPPGCREHSSSGWSPEQLAMASARAQRSIPSSIGDRFRWNQICWGPCLSTSRSSNHFYEREDTGWWGSTSRRRKHVSTCRCRIALRFFLSCSGSFLGWALELLHHRLGMGIYRWKHPWNQPQARWSLLVPSWTLQMWVVRWGPFCHPLAWLRLGRWTQARFRILSPQTVRRLLQWLSSWTSSLFD